VNNMSFPDLIQKLGLSEEFDSTKNEFHNFWDLMQEIYTSDPDMAELYLNVIYSGGQKRYDALKLINKSANIKTIFPQLRAELLDEMQTIYGQRDQIWQAVLETKDIKIRHSQIKNYPNILDAMNILPLTFSTNLLDLAIDPDVWMKISKIQDASTLRWLFENVAFGDVSYMVASGFLALIQASTVDDFLALIDLYQTTRLDIIRIVDQGLNTKTLVVDIHKIFMDKTIPLGNKQALLKGLTGFTITSPQDKLMWQQKIAANLFTPSHTDVVYVLKQLLLIAQDTILSGLLGLTVAFGNNGYARIQFLLQRILKDNKPHPILAEMSALTSADISSMLQELVWANQGDIFVANKFLDFTAGLPSKILNQFLMVYINSVNQTSVFPHLLQSIETAAATIYPYLCDEAGVVYKDLILELQMLDSVTRDNILADGSSTLFHKLQQLEGLPFLLAGVLKIGTREDPSQKPKENNITDFLNAITNTINDKQDFKNIAYAVNALANRQLTRLFIPFIQTKNLAIDRISCDNVANGREKSSALLGALCTADGTIRKTFISGILDNKAMTGVIDGLLLQAQDHSWQALTGFIVTVDSKSTADTIVDQYNSFLLGDSDPYRFVRLLAQMADTTQKSEKYYDALMQQSPAPRKQMINDIMTAGNIELLFDNIVKESEAGAIFQQLADVKKKSEPMYRALLIMLSKVNDDQMQEFRTLVNLKMINTDAYKDILDGLDSLQSVNGVNQINYQKVVRFISEIYNNPNFIEALHQAFDEKIPEEATAHVRFIVKIYDKGLIIDALDQLPLNKAMLLMKAFANRYDTLLEILNQLQSVAACVYLLKRLCYEDPSNGSYPVSLCNYMMDCFDGIATVETLESFIGFADDKKENLILDFETVITALYLTNPKIVDSTKTFLQQPLFMLVVRLLDAATRQNFLAEVLGDTNDTVRTFYMLSPNTMLPLLATYRKAGDLAKIHALRQTIVSTEGWVDVLHYFAYAAKDPYSKLLISVLKVAVSENFDIDMKKLERLKLAVDYFINLREALFRFAARPNIYLRQIVTLVNYFLEDGELYTSNGKINSAFAFPYKKLAVAEDDWVYSKFLAAVNFYGGKSKN
jgi:hypothetical protein